MPQSPPAGPLGTLKWTNGGSPPVQIKSLRLALVGGMISFICPRRFAWRRRSEASLPPNVGICLVSPGRRRRRRSRSSALLVRDARHVSLRSATLIPDTWAEKFESFERINSIRLTNGNKSCVSCNSWFPAVYMNCMSQNFRLLHVSNLSVRNFQIFLLIYPGSVAQCCCGRK